MFNCSLSRLVMPILLDIQTIWLCNVLDLAYNFSIRLFFNFWSQFIVCYMLIMLIIFNRTFELKWVVWELTPFSSSLLISTIGAKNYVHFLKIPSKEFFSTLRIIDHGHWKRWMNASHQLYHGVKESQGCWDSRVNTYDCLRQDEKSAKFNTFAARDGDS